MERYLQAVLTAIKAYDPQMVDDPEFNDAAIVDGEILLTIDGESIAIKVEVL